MICRGQKEAEVPALETASLSEHASSVDGRSAVMSLTAIPMIVLSGQNYLGDNNTLCDEFISQSEAVRGVPRNATRD